MCYANVNSQEDVSIIGRVLGIVTVVCAVLIILLVASGCGPKMQLGQGTKIEIKADNGAKQTINVGNKSVIVTPNTTIPLGAIAQ